MVSTHVLGNHGPPLPQGKALRVDFEVGLDCVFQMRPKLVSSFSPPLLFGLGLLVVLLACKRAELRDGATVRVITQQPDNCKDLGPVEGIGGGLAGGYLSK